ncbi:hypothetical protein LWS69_02955 [Bordetella hinzii]|nr:hypothetical protein [Bordetella hinzii]
MDVEWDEAGDRTWVSQPAALTPDQCRTDAAVLRLDPALPGLVVNASTRRVKTLAGLTRPRWTHWAPDFDAMRGLCEATGSTSLYP